MKLVVLMLLGVVLFASTILDNLGNKSKLSQKDIDTKQEGSYFTGLPLVSSDPDLGMGYGVRLYRYENGQKDDALFEHTPYKSELFIQAYATTGGWQYHWLNYDAPYIMDSLFRFSAELIYENDEHKEYLGLAKDSVVYDAQKASQNYYDYSYTRPIFSPKLQYDFVGGVVRGIAGLNISSSTVSALSDKSTLFNEDKSKNIVGFNGGWVNDIVLGVAYDTRDFEPDPKSGMFHEIEMAIGSSLLGSDYSYIDTKLTTRWFYSIYNDNITFAMQNIYQAQGGDVPFFDMADLGGRTTLRGVKAKMYIGNNKFQTNIESRIRFAYTKVGSQTFDFMLVPFFDTGKIYDRLAIDFVDYQSSYGAGLRVMWNKATIIYLDYGKSQSNSGMYINFKHIF
jgi:hypothetical protein